MLRNKTPPSAKATWNPPFKLSSELGQRLLYVVVEGQILGLGPRYWFSCLDDHQGAGPFIRDIFIKCAHVVSEQGTPANQDVAPCIPSCLLVGWV